MIFAFMSLDMGNAVKIPVIHEVTTSIQCLGDVLKGDLDTPNRRWQNYAEESVVGSGIYSGMSCQNEVEHLKATPLQAMITHSAVQ